MTRRRSSGPAARVRHLVALDASNVMVRLAARHEEMVALFSRLRTRAPLLQTVHSWHQSASFSELAALEPVEQRAVNAFYEVLGELRWYLEYTEDMPLKVRQQLALFMKRLAPRYKQLVQQLGAVPTDGAVVEGRVQARRQR